MCELANGWDWCNTVGWLSLLAFSVLWLGLVLLPRVVDRLVGLSGEGNGTPEPRTEKGTPSDTGRRERLASLILDEFAPKPQKPGTSSVRKSSHDDAEP